MFEKYSIQETVKKLDTDEKRGLSCPEAARRLLANGKNEMKAARKKTGFQLFLEQLQDPLIYVLIAAAAVSTLLGEVSDAVIIGVVVLLNAVVGMLQEGKARRALEALKKLTCPRAVALREGKPIELPAAELVTGDVVYLETGCQIPADLRLVQTMNLKVEESALTGEALPTEKDALFLVGKGVEAPLGDRRNMAYMSTIVTYGRGVGIVTATGMHTEIGQIASLISEEKEELTPLQKRLGELGKVLSVLSLGLCAALFGLAVLQKREIMGMLITAISLAVAAVPEGLPAVVTICLALSVTRMVKVNTIVRRLPSVETLGAVSVVCSDKTGTLTQNKMTVESCYWDNKLFDVTKTRANPPRDFLQGMVLCNDGVWKQNKRMGDPTELALLELADRYGVQKERLEQEFPRVGELPFDSERKMMTTCHHSVQGEWIEYTKGAPDRVLMKCTDILSEGQIIRLTEERKKRILKAVEEMSSQALRTLGIAMKRNVRSAREEGLIFVGLAGMRDPVRPEAAKTVEIFKDAGVRTVMITGDHVDTAYAIGKILGIVGQPQQCMTGEVMQRLGEGEFLQRLKDTRIFARVSPLQKVRIVKGFQQLGEIVAMTGDGVNDAPSLKMADIGIAMGKTGTDVAKQASDMILVDDNFATIEKAIEEGRGVYENIRKSVIFLLSSNLGELMTMFAAVLCGFASPLKSSHILWINLITDSLPALALGVDKNDGRALMRNKPRGSGESLFARGGLTCTCFYGVLIACISLTAFLLIPCQLLAKAGTAIDLDTISKVLGQELVLAKAQTYAFTVLGMSQLFHAVGMRDVEKSVFRMKHGENKLMILACLSGFLLQFAVTEVPFLVKAFGTASLSGREWLFLSGLAAVPLAAHELFALFSVKTICQR
ncbi:MAG: cation-translocating P-type ATPase [Roseburia sp.]|nr:cation-translocating P-type ATPase [Roseburia sp.]